MGMSSVCFNILTRCDSKMLWETLMFLSMLFLSYYYNLIVTQKFGGFLLWAWTFWSLTLSLKHIKPGFDYTVFELISHKFTVFYIPFIYICNVFVWAFLPLDYNLDKFETLMVIIFCGMPRKAHCHACF